jgi:hypothetical protein
VSVLTFDTKGNHSLHLQAATVGFSRNSTEPTGRRENVVSDAFFKIGEEFVLRLEGTDALGIPGSRRWQFESHLKRSRQK